MHRWPMCAIVQNHCVISSPASWHKTEARRTNQVAISAGERNFSNFFFKNCTFRSGWRSTHGQSTIEGKSRRILSPRIAGNVLVVAYRISVFSLKRHGTAFQFYIVVSGESTSLWQPRSAKYQNSTQKRPTKTLYFAIVE